MAWDSLKYVPGIPIQDAEEFENDMQLYKSICESRRKYKETLEILSKINNAGSSSQDQDNSDTDSQVEFLLTFNKELKTSNIKNFTIQNIHSGTEVFRQDLVGRLFCINSLSPEKFNIGEKIKKYHGRESSELLLKLRSNAILPTVNDPGLARYLFFVMSIHVDNEIRSSCLSILTGMDNNFKVALNDIFAVFVNWGFEVDNLYPKSSNIIFQLPGPIENLSANDNVQINNLQPNIEYVLSYLKTWTSSTDEIKFLIRILLLSSLEKRFHTNEFHNCICAIMGQNTWSIEEVGSLVEILHFKDLHFHNQAQASVIMASRSQFASRVCTSLAYASLQQLLLNETIYYVQKVDVQCLLNLNLNITKKSYYDIYMIVWFLTLCVKDLHSEAGHKDCMKKLCAWLTKVKEYLNYGITVCDKQILLEYLTRIINNWSNDFNL